MRIRTSLHAASLISLFLAPATVAHAIGEKKGPEMRAGQVHYWHMSKGLRKDGADIFAPVGSNWSLGGVGDLDGDGTDDIVWQREDGQVQYWPMLGGRRLGGKDIHTPVGSDWFLRGVGDVDGDSTDDIVWQREDGQVHYWGVSKARRTRGVDIHSPVASDQFLRGVGDVNGDGTDDIVWQASNGQVHYWPMRNGGRTGDFAISSPVANSWSLVGAGDVNGDGTDDIVWQASNGQVHYWPMRSGARRDPGIDIHSPIEQVWALRGVGDVNGDGTDDIVLQARNAGDYPSNMTAANARAMIARLGSARQGIVDGPTSHQQHAAGNHINGMARVGQYWAVNYTDTGRETGRVLYWNRGSGGSYSVYRVSRVGGGNNYLGGMDGAKDILAFTTRTPSLRFLRMPPGGSPTELQAFTYADGTNINKLGLAHDADGRAFVLVTRNSDRNIEVREGSPGNWTLRGTLPAAFATSWSGSHEESMPLVYMGNGVFAAFVLKPNDDPFQFSYQVFTLQGSGNTRMVVPYSATSTVTLQHSEPFAYRFDPFRGYPNFRWAGAVVFNGIDLEMCASSRELNNAYNGMYSCWRTR